MLSKITRGAVATVKPSPRRASQMARGCWRVVDTGYLPCSDDLGRRPEGALVGLLVQQTGVGKMRHWALLSEP
ncbi:hypothetical protein LMG28140_04505 [Paraburkholderia metrosideri]|uniref:Transposase n=1 Tax=Paraburkholderia metrosideri TaxID=580937 RepID=A0ABM8NX55_9BURK|nr:hypothetical protein LMG28140_04505 [Paraburkholderia metrosideri]